MARRVLPKIGQRTRQIYADIVTLAFNNYNIRFHVFTVDAEAERKLAENRDVELETEAVLIFNPEVFTSTILAMLDTLKKFLDVKDLELDDTMKAKLAQLKEKIDTLLE